MHNMPNCINVVLGRTSVSVHRRHVWSRHVCRTVRAVRYRHVQRHYWLVHMQSLSTNINLAYRQY